MTGAIAHITALTHNPHTLDFIQAGAMDAGGGGGRGDRTRGGRGERTKLGGRLQASVQPFSAFGALKFFNLLNFTPKLITFLVSNR